MPDCGRRYDSAAAAAWCCDDDERTPRAMTAVHIKIEAPGPRGSRPAAGRKLTWTPTRRRRVDGTVVLPAPFPVELDAAGTATGEVAPTEATWCLADDRDGVHHRPNHGSLPARLTRGPPQCRR